jgi:hypothetical protein
LRQGLAVSHAIFASKPVVDYPQSSALLQNAGIAPRSQSAIGGVARRKGFRDRISSIGFDLHQPTKLAAAYHYPDEQHGEEDGRAAAGTLNRTFSGQRENQQLNPVGSPSWEIKQCFNIC